MFLYRVPYTVLGKRGRTKDDNVELVWAKTRMLALIEFRKTFNSTAVVNSSHIHILDHYLEEQAKILIRNNCKLAQRAEDQQRWEILKYRWLA